MPPYRASPSSAQSDDASVVNYETCIGDLARTVLTVLSAVPRASNDARDAVEDGVGVVALRDLSAGDVVMACGWPDQCGATPSGLCVVTDEQVRAANTPAWLAKALRRRFYSDAATGLQAIPISARGYMCHSQQQYVNAARDDGGANVIYDVASDAYLITRNVRAGEELLYPSSKATAFRPGGGADATATKDEGTARAALKWTQASTLAPVIVASSDVHGLGLFAAAPVPRGSLLQISIHKAEERELGMDRVGCLRHEVLCDKLARVRDNGVRREIKLQVHRRYAFDRERANFPLVGGLNRLSPAQLMNHGAPPLLKAVLIDGTNGRLNYLFVRDVAEGEELTEDYEKEVSEEYFRWAIHGGAEPPFV